MSRGDFAQQGSDLPGIGKADQPLPLITLAQVDRARRYVAGRARDIEDAGNLLEALGLLSHQVTDATRYEQETRP